LKPRPRPAHDFLSRENKKWCNTNALRFSLTNLDKARSLLAVIGIKDRNKDGVMKDEAGKRG